MLSQTAHTDSVHCAMYIHYATFSIVFATIRYSNT